MSTGRPSFLGVPIPRAFDVRVVSIAPGEELTYHPAQWHDALVGVEAGEVELEGPCGSLVRFVRGDMLWLIGLPLRLLRNPGSEPAVLVAVSRRRPDSGDPPMSFRPVHGLDDRPGCTAQEETAP
jgi:quercetin dioxygenase-like cupin family protein